MHSIARLLTHVESPFVHSWHTVIRIAAEPVTALGQKPVEVIEHDVRKQWREDALNAKGNFCFERAITGNWRGQPVLDLRRKQ